MVSNPGQRELRLARTLIRVALTDEAERLTRIEQLIEQYRAAKQRRIVRRAIKLWRVIEANRRLAGFEAQPDRVH